MAKIFDFYPGKGSLKDQVSGAIPTNTNAVIVTATKGRVLSLSSAADLLFLQVLAGVKTIVLWINPTADTKLLIDGIADKLEIAGGNITGTGLTECYVNSIDTDAVTLGAWSCVIAEFSAGIAFATNIKIDPTAAVQIGRIAMFDTLPSSGDRARIYAEFQHAQTIQPAIFLGGSRYITKYNGTNMYARKAISNYRSADTSGTILAWINVANYASEPCFFCTADEAAGTNYFIGYVSSGGKIVMSAYNGATLPSFIGTTVLTTGKWYHVAMVSNSIGWSVYLNGNSEIRSVGADNGQWFSHAVGRDNLVIGALIRNLQQRFWNGLIGDVKIYNTHLTLAQIQADYRTGWAGVAPVNAWQMSTPGNLLFDTYSEHNLSFLGAAPGAFWTQSLPLHTQYSLISIDGTNCDADGVSKSTGQIGDFAVSSGTFACTEDATGKLITCSVNGVLQVKGINLSLWTGNGYVSRIDGSLSAANAGMTVDAAPALSWAGNVLSITMTAGQVIRNLLITRGA